MTKLMQILLIEDDLSLAQGLIRSLRHDRFTVNHLSLGRQAINSIKTTAPDIVILDLGLPDMDGTAVLAEIRKVLEAASMIGSLGWMPVLMIIWPNHLISTNYWPG